ncbi:bifunctional metallophosphatase/5'-nucleotidase [Erysipelothrix larvae]|uniref:Bifunctional metallophosphatase/5'-nucleotidase n=1 Tax=Erysipelothrix larvae TaxID=1514105 RepID=A0A0X8GY21_9FIRM|nr:bifunctional UDP-sugar hydrolase/5'-nucleotidase [Erysipelothrix larvae]AMC92529.1 bifunctional metallophosphatase/5'-nucleotidase [Erysipelothrix larvae]
MKLTILATTDIHGRIYPTDYTSRDNVSSFGLSRFSTYVKKMREREDIILVDNGDSFQGTPLTAYAHQHPNSYMNPSAYAFNVLNYDFLNLGNHDFNYGPKILKKYIDEVKAPLLTSNVLIDGTLQGSTQVIERGGKKIAFIGVVTHYIPNWERESYIKNMQFLDAYQTMAREVARVKNHVDLVIGMYHGGLERDPKTGEPTERQTGENQGYQMCSIEGLDILITGHQHRSLVERINGVLVTQTTYNAIEFAQIEVDLDTLDNKAHILHTSELPVDEHFLEPLNLLQSRVQNWLDKDIGVIDDMSPSLIIDDEFEARLHKHPLVSFINQVQTWKTGATLSAVALFNGAIGFGKHITMRELVSTYIFPNTLVVKKMTGKTIKEMIEFSALYYVLDDNGNIAVNPRYVTPKPQHYNYDMLDGIEYTLNISNPKFHRIESITHNGNPLDDDDEFSVAMNNYRASGGGNYAMVSECETILDIQEEMLDIMVEYFQSHTPVHVIHHDNITITNH